MLALSSIYPLLLVPCRQRQFTPCKGKERTSKIHLPSLYTLHLKFIWALQGLSINFELTSSVIAIHLST